MQLVSAKMYKTRHERELCQKSKYERTNRGFTHKLESVPEKETHNLLWDFEIQSDHIISARQSDL